MINLRFKKHIFVHFLTIIFIVLSTPVFSEKYSCNFDTKNSKGWVQSNYVLDTDPVARIRHRDQTITTRTSGDWTTWRRKTKDSSGDPVTVRYKLGRGYDEVAWVHVDFIDFPKNQGYEQRKIISTGTCKLKGDLVSASSNSNTVENLKQTRPNYAERCNLSVDDVKEVQRSLKKIGLYTSSIDGIAGKGTETGIALAKAKLGMNASPGECFNQADVKASRAMMPDLLCDFDVEQCSDKMLCTKGIFTSAGKRWWKSGKDKKFADKAKSLGLSCGMKSVCDTDNLTDCTANDLCDKAVSTFKVYGVTKPYKRWLTKYWDSYVKEARSRGLNCGVNSIIPGCSILALDGCSETEICTKATNLTNGVRSWKGLGSVFVERAKATGLDCGITVDSTPLTQQEAIYFLSQLTDFVTANTSNFGLDFASEFNKVRPITQGNWSSNLSEVFENFRAYSLKLESFQQYIEDVRLAEETRDKKRIEELRASINQDIIILKNWGKANVLDEKAAQIAVLVREFGNKDLQTINELEQTSKRSQNLLAATGIKDGPVQDQTQDIVDSLYNPSSIYVFANMTGDAENLYKNLDGNFDFEQTTGTHCSSDKFTTFDQYIFTKKFFENFKDLTTLNGSCSPSSDIFVAKGNELTSDRLFNQVNLSGLELIFEMTKDQRDAEFDQLAFLKTAIKNDVMDGIRVGFGLLRSDTSSQRSCGIIKDQDQGHIAQLDNNRMLLIALGYEQESWEGFDKTTQSDEEAFKMLQRGQCGFIYGSELTLARVYLASERAKIKLEFLPIWISPTAVENSQRLYDAEKTAEAEANLKVEKSSEEQELLAKQKSELEKQKLEDQLVLEQQALKSAGEVAAVRQRAMREQNGLKFSVLKDKLQDLLFIAVQFGLENSVEEGSYESKYLEQPFVDPILSNSVFDGVITDMQILASERWEVTEQKLNQIDFGEAIFKGRALDALVVELLISSKNRLIGQYQEYCRRVHIIFDDDFEMWRSPEIGECDQSITKTGWYNSWQFQSKWIAQP